MVELLLAPESVSQFATFTLMLLAVTYLVRLPEKSHATHWLIGMLSCMLVAWASLLIVDSLVGLAEDALMWTLRTLSIAMVAGMTAYLQFAYHFLGNPYPRESRIALIVFGFLTTTLILSAYMQIGSVFLVQMLILIALSIWTTVVCTRKWRRSKREGEVRTAKAFRSYSFLGLFGITAFMLMGLSSVNSINMTTPWVSILFVVCIYQFVFGLIAIYLSYAPEHSSFQAKLVGLSLVTVLGLLAIVSALVGVPMMELDQESSPEGESLRFTPDEEGGYLVSTSDLPSAFELGEPLRMSDDSARIVAAGFEFPFYGRRWDSLYVSPNGAVSFGEPLYRSGEVAFSGRAEHLTYFFNDVPKIAPLFVDLNPTAGGDVYVRRGSDRMVVTWHEIPRFDLQEPTTFRLVLHADGRFDFVYEDIAPLRYGARGISPGNVEIGLSDASLSADLPYRIPAGSARAEEYSYKIRKDVNETATVLVWLVLLGTLFVLVVFPLFFRSSLLEPLERLVAGTRRVHEGDLDTQVPVRVHDEIGRLTDSFNEMTRSLRSYARDLEEKVADRTAELETLLAELKAAQTQLVQQEKLASLGALTAGIAHEIKNPLNFITNFAAVTRELVEELDGAVEEGDQETARAIAADLAVNASKIEEHGKRANGIVRSMLEHSRGTKGERRPTNLNRLVEEYVNLAFHGMRAQTPGFEAAVERDFDESIPQVSVVPQDIGRVLLNLLQNAFYAVNEQKAEQNGQYAPVVRIGTRAVDEHVEIRVEDNGPGIPESVRAKIFEPFFTTKPTGSGTGLGLSLSYEIVVQGHGGHLRVEASESGGAAFVVSLPMTVGAPAERPK